MPIAPESVPLHGSDEGGTGSTPQPRPRTVLARPWFAVIAVVVAVAMIVTTAIIAIPRIWPAAAAVPPLADAVPSAFPVTLTPVTSPAVHRGQAVTIQVQSASDTAPDSLEIWQDATLLMRVDHPDAPEVRGAHLLNLQLDVVPTVAGQHELTARVIDANGDLAQSTTIPMAILDLPVDLGERDRTMPALAKQDEIWTYGTSEFRSIPGDTLTSIAGRLAVSPTDLIAAGRLPDSIAGPDDVIAAQTMFYAPIAAPAVAKNPASYHLPADASPQHLAAHVDGCDVVVDSTGYTATVALYSGPQLRRVGEVAPESSTRLTGLPVGLDLIVGYIPGVKPNTSGTNGPSVPLAVTVPDACGGEGWSGDVREVNGVLVSSLNGAAPANPYLYVSVDGGAWNRFPSRDDSYLGGATLVDVSSAAEFTGADQINLELWNQDGGTATQVGAGAFCRALIGAAPGTAPSAAGCSAPVATHPTESEAVLTLTRPPLTIPGATVLAPVPPATDSIALSGDAAVPLHVTLTGASDADAVELQYSFFPLSTATTALSPPGVFHTETIPLTGPVGARSASFEATPWKWRNLKLDPAGDPSADAGDLALDDEMTRSVAMQTLQAQGGLVRDVYLRVVAVVHSGGYGSWQTTPVGPASTTIHVDLGGGYPAPGTVTLPQPTIQVEPGKVVPAMVRQWDQVANEQCVSVQSYPDANTWEQNPWAGPVSGHPFSPFGVTLGYTKYSGTPAAPGDVLLNAGNQALSDRGIALATFTNPSWAYCNEGRPDAIASAQAAIQKAAQGDCGFVCVLTSVIVGALVGFVYGGPYGAIAGAVVGLAVGLTHAFAPDVFAQLQKLWDAVASIYNGIYSAIGKLVNLVACGPIAAASSTAGKVCGTIASAALAVVWAIYVGTPPSIPTSEAIDAISKDGLSGLIYTAIEAAGVDCDALTVSGETASDIRSVAGEAGSHTADKALEAARPAGSDDISVCLAVANLVSAEALDELEDQHGQLIDSAYQTGYTPGLVLAPFVDTAPRITITASAIAANSGAANACPVVGSVFLRHGSTSIQLTPVESTLQLGVGSGGVTWGTTLTIPVPWYWGDHVGIPSSAFIDTKPADPGQARLTVDITSPCFAQTYRVQLDGVDDATSATDGYVQLTTPIARYYRGYGLTSTP